VVDSRVVAVQAMHALLVDGRSFTTVLVDAEARVPTEARPRLRALCFEWARWATQLAVIVDSKLDKPLRNKDADVYLLMQLGVLELNYMQTPAHTAVNETVKALKGLRKPWAKGLVNAVLRNTQRNPIDIESFSAAEKYAYPEWWVQRIKKDWPDQIDAVLNAGNQRAPMTLRVNALHSTPSSMLEELQDKGIAAIQHPYASNALELEKPLPIADLSGFNDGLVSVQDAAAQLLVPLLDAAGVNPHLVLDACAAPGGKTALLLETYEAAEVIALDQSELRLTRVADTLTRLSFESRATCQAVDAANVADWWNGTAFDLVLLDAPCTGSGVIRRHPDIKHTRREEDVESLAQQQAYLLHELWATVAEGGYLLYATCSIMRDENSRQIEEFLSSHADASDATPGNLEWGRAQAVGYQVLPGDHNMDGFYYALIRKSRDG